MNSNVKSDSDLIATNRSVAKAVLAIHVIIAELANKKFDQSFQLLLSCYLKNIKSPVVIRQRGTKNIRGTTLLPAFSTGSRSA